MCMNTRDEATQNKYCFSDNSLSTRIKDAGIAIRHSRGRILFYTAGSRNGLEGMETVCPQGSRRRPGTHKKKLYLRKRHFFVNIETYVVNEDARKTHPGSAGIDKPPGPGVVKDELRPISSKKVENHKKKNSQFQLFGFRKSEAFLPEANPSLLAGRFSALSIFGNASGF